jgi:hypothetical protein
VTLEVGNNVGTLVLLTLDDSLVVLFERFVLALVLAGKHFILVSNKLGTFDLLGIDNLSTVVKEFFLKFEV